MNIKNLSHRVKTYQSVLQIVLLQQVTTIRNQEQITSDEYKLLCLLVDALQLIELEVKER